MNREQWLQKIAEEFKEELFEKNGYKVPENIRVSCGLPSRGAFSTKKQTVGQCFSSKVSDDEHFEIFISPTISESIEVAGCLLHEMIHAVVGCEAGHRKPFSQCARKLGLVGKMTATEPGEKLMDMIKYFLTCYGEYPHADLNCKPKKKQSTRMLKIVCNNPFCIYQEVEEKKYTVRMSQAVYDFAPPKCGSCEDWMEIEHK